MRFCGDKMQNGGQIIFYYMFKKCDSVGTKNAYNFVLNYPLPVALDLCRPRLRDIEVTFIMIHIFKIYFGY